MPIKRLIKDGADKNIVDLFSHFVPFFFQLNSSETFKSFVLSGFIDFICLSVAFLFLILHVEDSDE